MDGFSGGGYGQSFGESYPEASEWTNEAYGQEYYGIEAEAASWKAREQAEREAQEQAEREAREKAEREEREAREREARERYEREAREREERLNRENAEKEAKEKAEKEARELRQATPRGVPRTRPPLPRSSTAPAIRGRGVPPTVRGRGSAVRTASGSNATSIRGGASPGAMRNIRSASVTQPRWLQEGQQARSQTDEQIQYGQPHTDHNIQLSPTLNRQGKYRVGQGQNRMNRTVSAVPTLPRDGTAGANSPFGRGRGGNRLFSNSVVQKPTFKPAEELQTTPVRKKITRESLLSLPPLDDLVCSSLTQFRLFRILFD